MTDDKHEEPQTQLERALARARGPVVPVLIPDNDYYRAVLTGLYGYMKATNAAPSEVAAEMLSFAIGLQFWAATTEMEDPMQICGGRGRGVVLGLMGDGMAQLIEARWREYAAMIERLMAQMATGERKH